METKDYKLHKFLRKHGVVRKFKANVKSEGHYIYRDILEYGEKDRYVISGAFSWSLTPQDHRFWCDLDDKYSADFQNHKL